MRRLFGALDRLYSSPFRNLEIFVWFRTGRSIRKGPLAMVERLPSHWCGV